MKDKIFIKFSAVTLVNSLMNLIIFTVLLFLTKGTLLSACYILSSLTTTSIAYFLNKHFVFKSIQRSLFRFFFIEICLITFTVLFFELYNLFLDYGIIASYVIIYGSRFCLSYIFIKKLFLKV